MQQHGTGIDPGPSIKRWSRWYRKQVRWISELSPAPPSCETGTGRIERWYARLLPLSIALSTHLPGYCVVELSSHLV